MRLPHFVLLGTLAALLAACAPFHPSTTLPVTVAASPNFGPRRPNLVIIHHTGSQSVERALHSLRSPAREVSAHYLIARDGRIFQLVDEQARAWHAGHSWWGGQADVNSASLGIELDNDGNEPFAEAQIVSLLALLADIRQRYEIPAANFLGHADVAPARKVDPSAYFPWRRLAQHGFGLWCDRPLPLAPPGLDLALALSALGYDTGVPETARQAFRLHYMPGDPAPLEEDEKALAYCLQQLKAMKP